MRPISVVDGAGFREFCQAMEPRYCVPSRGTVKSRIVGVYNSTLDKIKESIKDKDVALTTDGWTSLATASYVTVTAHWISDDWEMLNKVLKTKELKESHTAENVGQCIQEILDFFGVERVIAITTDNATNYVNAVERHLQMVNIPCVAHTLNLAVRKGSGSEPLKSPLVG
ncbi:putative AC9 transposase [Merluccius polli]|uniref:AC9 transposase n=1 Tax=Merluccius polli TaxID=89951 RepID=A0AA47MVA3_MERPO|nr:putative AC9 transposase [Merluccius polli]